MIEHIKGAAETVRVGLFYFLLGLTLMFIWNQYNPRQLAAALEVVSLEFRDGKFWQSVRSKAGREFRAYWGAKIVGSDGNLICSGGGIAPYGVGYTPKIMTPNQWTGGDCSGLIVGREYKASATWEWRVGDGWGRLSHNFNYIHSEAEK